MDEVNAMRISIFGLGYVGAVCAGCLSARGHEVVGVDVSRTKIDLINHGKSPIVEPGLEELLQQGLKSGRLRGTTDVSAAVQETQVSFICVGTPSKKNGDLSLDYIEGVCREIGFAPITEIRIYEKKGLRFIGPLPAEVQQHNTYVASAMRGSPNAKAAAELVRFLGAPQAKKALVAGGVE